MLSKNTFSTEHLQTTASEFLRYKICLKTLSYLSIFIIDTGALPISDQSFFFISHENTKKDRFSIVFRGYKMRTLVRNGLKMNVQCSGIIHLLHSENFQKNWHFLPLDSHTNAPKNKCNTTIYSQDQSFDFFFFFLIFIIFSIYSSWSKVHFNFICLKKKQQQQHTFSKLAQKYIN